MARVSGPYDIERVRAEWIGRESEPVRGRYPVEYDPIRRHCHMIDDTNPLFLDPEYAARGPYGAVIAPPLMLDYFAGGGAWPPDRAPEYEGLPAGLLLLQVPTPGDQLINLSQEIECPRPVRVGDWLSGRMRIADVYQKPIKLDPAAVWIVSEHILSNQRGEVVSIVRNTILTHRKPEEVAAS